MQQSKKFNGKERPSPATDLYTKKGKIIIQKAKLKMEFQSVAWKLVGVQRS
jgi:hypothetical protein